MTPWMRSTLLPGILGLAALTLAVLAGSLALLQAPLQDLTLLGLFLLASGALPWPLATWRSTLAASPSSTPYGCVCW